MRCFSMAVLVWLAATGLLAAQPLGHTLPNFTFRTVEGETVTLNQLRESSPSGVVTLTFWCTSCASCRASEQSLAGMAQRFKKDAVVVALASSRQDTPESVKAYLDKEKLDLVVLVDEESAAGHHLDVRRTTTTVVLDKEGHIRYFGTLVKRRKTYAEDALESLVKRGIVSQPVGPILG